MVTENSTNPQNDVVRSGMMHDPDTWPNKAHTANAEIMAQPRDWNVACAAAQVRMGVPLTDAQRVLVEKSTAARPQ